MQNRFWSPKNYLLFTFLLFFASCGVKLGPQSPALPPPETDYDCSIYDRDCKVSDPRYDPSCDPAKGELSQLCIAWNKRYEEARIAYRKRLELIKSQEDTGEWIPPPPHRLTAEEITP